MTTLTELFDGIDISVPPHSVVFGGTGQGKTTLLEHQQLHGARAGTPRVVLCPHGDLTSRGLPIATNHDEAVVVYDFADADNRPQWNLTVPPVGLDDQSWAVELVRVIKACFPSRNEEWFGPVGTRALRVACEVLVRDVVNGKRQPLTRLVELLDPEQRDAWTRSLSRIGDDRLRTDMNNVWSMIADDKQSHAGLWLTSKVEPLVADPRIAAIIGSTDNSVDPSAIIHGATMLVSAPAADFGDEGSNLLLGTMLAQVWHHARSSARQTGKTLEVFIDEVQRFSPEVLLPMLAESRKYGVKLRLATQTPNALAPKVRDAIVSNCGAISTFRLGSRDAAELAPAFPASGVDQLARLARHRLATSFGDDEMFTATEPPLSAGPTAG